MRIGYFGDGAWARQALRRVLDDPDLSVAYLVPRFDQPDEQLVAMAQLAGVEVLRLANVNAPEALRQLDAYQADLVVSMSFNQIFKSGLLRLCPGGAVNCHAGALPCYRGRNILNWALINDEREFGVTVHYMDDGIDTGDIIAQRLLPIDDTDTYATLLERAIATCADLLHDALRQLARGTAGRTVQQTIHPVGFYVGRRVVGDEWIDWSWPSRRVFNFVRAITTPGPCARAVLDGQEVQVVRAELIPQAPDYLGTPGEIVGRDPAGGLTVKTGDSTIRLTELAAAAPLRPRIGKRFQSRTDARIAELEQRLAALEAPLSPR